MRRTYCRRSDGAALLVVLCCLVGSTRSHADDTYVPVTAGSTVALQTEYLAHPIGRARRIVIRGQLGGKGHVVLDGNTCTISQFGDPEVCSSIPVARINVTIEPLRIADPAGNGRRIFRLSGKLDPEDSTYFLIVPRRGSEPHRLVVAQRSDKQRPDKRRVVPLRAVSKQPTSKLELCMNAKYSAKQSGGKVTIYANVQHPTGGWKAALEQLPMEVFPPQYRLVCVEPSGIVTQVITPEEVQSSFRADDPVTRVTVHDAKGRHQVPVRQED